MDIPWFDTAAFQLQPIYTYGNAGSFITEAEVGKTGISRSRRISASGVKATFVQFRTETFQPANHVNFGNPQGSFASSAFGKVTSATSARQIQFGLRYQF